MQTHQYNTLEDIELRKDELRAQLSDNSDKVGNLWRSLWVPQKTESKGVPVGPQADEDLRLAIWPS